MLSILLLSSIDVSALFKALAEVLDKCRYGWCQDQIFAKGMWQPFYLQIFKDFTFNLAESRNEDENIHHILLLASFNRTQCALAIISEGSTAYLMYSNIAITLIEESHISGMLYPKTSMLKIIQTKNRE